MKIHEAASAWLAAWSKGWARHDPAVIAGRYAPNCVAEHLDTWTEADGDLGIAIRPEASR